MTKIAFQMIIFLIKKQKNLDRDALLKKYKLKLPSDEMILKILENSGINYKDIRRSKQ